MTIESLGNLLIKAEESWYLRRGLYFALLASLIAFEAFFWLVNSALSTLIFFKTYEIVLPLARICGHIFCFGLVSASWFLSRRLPEFSTSEVVILFAPYGDEQVKARINDLRERLKFELAALKNQRIKLKTLKPHIVIDSQEKAHDIRNKTNCYLIIWGYVTRNTHKQRPIDGFLQIYFTYKHPRMTYVPAINLCKNVATSIAGRKWIVRCDEEFRDVPTLVTNIKETAFFIIGVVLSLYKEHDQSLAIFERLKAELDVSTRKKYSSKYRFLFRSNVELWLREVCLEASKHIYREKIFLFERFNLDPTVLRECLIRTQRALSMKSNWAQAHLNLATIYFLLGDIPKARFYVNEAKQYSDDLSAAWLSNAFLDLVEGHFDNAIKEYEIALKKISAPELLSEVIVFISHYLDSNPSLIQLRIAIGILCQAMGNDLAAKFEFETFLSECNGRDDLSGLKAEADRYLDAFNANPVGAI